MIAYLNIEIKKRIGQDRLIQLTNFDATATIIKEDTLDSASADAIGIFRYITGLEPEIGNYGHTAILIKGIQYYLENYKGRESSVIVSLEKAFIKDCLGLRERLYTSPLSNSNIDIKKEIEEDKTRDFPRNHPIFNQNSSWHIKD
jgi:hypothetical protein